VRVLGLTAVLGVAGTAAAGAAVGTAIGSVHRGTVAAGRLELGTVAFSYPTLNAAGGLILALAALGVVTLAGVVRAGWRQRRAHRRFLTAVQVLGQLDGHSGVTVIAGARPEAFCAGFLKPTVYISRGALDVLGPAELEAVLAHEHHHRQVRDPLRLACGRVLAHALFFVPVLRPLRDQYAELAELQADDAAVRVSEGRPQPLASALLVFDASAPHGASGISATRVDSLLGEPQRSHVSRLLLAWSIAVLAAVSVLIWGASGGASAHATFEVPVVSSTPCLSLLLILPLLVCIGARRLRPRAAGA
jgi:Zn-dependent protease with chaperone function